MAEVTENISTAESPGRQAPFINALIPMKIRLYLLPLLFLPAFSCKIPKTKAIEKYCIVNLDSLKHSIDTLKVGFYTFSQEDSIEMQDTSVQNGEGGVFHFDSKGHLGLYAFMYDWPYSGFMIRYDSKGRKNRLQEEEVVQWRYDSLRKDSILNLTVLLCAVDRNYGDLALSAGTFYDSSIQLFDSRFTKIICFKSKVPLKGMPANSYIYLRGTRGEKCSGLTSPFTDSFSIRNLKNGS